MILRLDLPLSFERSKQAADVAGIKLEPFAQDPDVNAVRTHLVKKPCFAQWATPMKIAVLQCANVLCHDPVEPAHLLNVVWLHYLTLVRYRWSAREWASIGR